MSIDYEKLRERLEADESQSADALEKYAAVIDLSSSGKDTARELLRVHDELIDLRDSWNRVATTHNSSEDPVAQATAGIAVKVVNGLNRILQGDNK